MFRLKRWVTILLIILLLSAVPFACGNIFGDDHEGKQLIKVTHIVKFGDTIGSIAAFYCPPDYGYTERRQFEHDIIYKWNKDLFKGRMPGLIYPKDVLLMEFWGRIDVD